MVELKNLKGIYLYPDTVSFAKGIPGLTNLISVHFQDINVKDCLFIFFDKDKQKKSPAFKVVELINSMFHEESEMHSKNFTKSQIEEHRKSDEYKKIIEDIDKTILGIDYDYNTYLSKACKYYINSKKELYTFLENGYIDISNNIGERTVKPFVIARKNFMFCKTSDGATATGKIFSIVQTARANGLRVEEYIKYVLENINKKDISELLPWSEEVIENLKIK